jgi:hypothetical protein
MGIGFILIGRRVPSGTWCCDKTTKTVSTHKSTTLIDVRLAPTSGAKAEFPYRRLVP